MTTPVTLPTSFVLSDVITGMDANPNVRFSAGQGGAGRVVIQSSTINVSATLATTTGLRLVRIPSNSIVKAVKIGIDLAVGTATSAVAVFGLLFSDNQYDGTTAANTANANQFSSACFAATTGAGYSLGAALVNAVGLMKDITYQAALGVTTFTDGFYVPSASEMPIWLAITQGGPSPQTPGAWAGTGATSLSTSPSYQLSADPGGFFDVYMQPTTTFSIAGAFQLTTEVTYITT